MGVFRVAPKINHAGIKQAVNLQILTLANGLLGSMRGREKLWESKYDWQGDRKGKV